MVGVTDRRNASFSSTLRSVHSTENHPPKAAIASHNEFALNILTDQTGSVTEEEWEVSAAERPSHG
jgi:hypothetical protein